MQMYMCFPDGGRPSPPNNSWIAAVVIVVGVAALVVGFVVYQRWQHHSNVSIGKRAAPGEALALVLPSRSYDPLDQSTLQELSP